MKSCLLLICAASLYAAPAVCAQIPLDLVTIGNPGNPNDTVTAGDGSGLFFGGVTYTYAIGKYEVTLTQYAEFLSAVAKTDTYGIFNESMATDVNIAGISRSGAAGAYEYATIGDGQRPVAYVSWFDAARFTNWLHNGKPIGLQTPATTEDGAYTLNGALSGVSITKNAGAQFWIPSENEWYKAAYYDPQNSGADGGGTADYWLYPTQSDIASGNVVGALPNQANYLTNVFSVTQSEAFESRNYLTPVGAFSSSASHYGTYDQGGNLWEWNDAVIDSIRGLRGDSWSVNAVTELQSSARGYSDPTFETDYIGFRVATIPEPTTAVSLLFGFGVLSAMRKREYWRDRLASA